MKKHFATLGPAIPIVPVKDFSSLRLTSNQQEELWSIVGPSVAMNFSRGVPLWKIFVAAYAEGLNHGSALFNEDLNKVADPRTSSAEVIQQYREVPINAASRKQKARRNANGRSNQ